jgi:hypothetical protein
VKEHFVYILLSISVAACPGAVFQLIDNGCTITEDCTKFTCKKTLQGEEGILVMKINKCHDPITIDTTLNLLGSSWSHTFNSDDSVTVDKIPFASGVSLKVNVHLNNTKTRLQLSVSKYLNYIQDNEKDGGCTHNAL